MIVERRSEKLSLTVTRPGLQLDLYTTQKYLPLEFFWAAWLSQILGGIRWASLVTSVNHQMMFDKPGKKRNTSVLENFENLAQSR